MLIAYIPLLVAIIGVLLYALCVNPKLAELGRIMFFCGLLATMFVWAGHTVRIL